MKFMKLNKQNFHTLNLRHFSLIAIPNQDEQKS
jgi:hypothetical protein